jgi:hypothetical protein
MESGEGWQKQLTRELGLTPSQLQLSGFTRVTPLIHDPRLVLQIDTPFNRRMLYLGIKQSQTPVRAHMHLTPQIKANKTLVYFTIRRIPVSIDDRGDIIGISWRSHPTVSERIDVGRSAAEVEATLETFLENRPSVQHPPPHEITAGRQTPMGG